MKLDCIYFKLNKIFLTNYLKFDGTDFNVFQLLDGSSTPVDMIKSNQLNFLQNYEKIFTEEKFKNFSSNATISSQKFTFDTESYFTIVTKISSGLLKASEKIYIILVKDLKSGETNSAILDFVSYSDLFIIIPIFIFVSFQLVLMFRKVYYILFSQINLFAYKLKRFNQNMLKEQNNNKFKNFNIEELIFTEDNEVKLFFKKFFEKFNQNENDNFFDVKNKLINDNSEGIFGVKEYSVKFNENVINPIEKELISRRRSRNNSVTNF